MLTDAHRILHQPFSLDYIEHRVADRGGERRACISVEIAMPRAEGAENLWARDHRADGVAVTHGFSHGDDVRRHAMALETPPGRPRAAEAGLHFIGDEQAVGAVNHIDGGAQETGWIGKDAVAREDAVDSQGRKSDAISL